MGKYNLISMEKFSQIRFLTRVVNVGRVQIGGQNPIRIQSMTNTNTMDIKATVEQAIQLAKAGCELVRITAPGVKEAENLARIKEELINRGFDIPLIADIHFNPKAAEVAAGIVEKVRINPGNYTDRNRGKISFSDIEYQTEINRIRERIAPLIKICKANETAMRIGSNHGSLSGRIMSRYGDTPLGMVEAALEFVRICREFDYHSLVLSMKSSNVRIMVEANRLLVRKMIEEKMNYPIHLGVTEAGDGDEGRIKSAAGIGTLLSTGIGDTIRVSLTEPPENEIPMAGTICKYFYTLPVELTKNPFEDYFNDPITFEKRLSSIPEIFKNLQYPLVIGSGEPYNVSFPDIIYSDGFLFYNGKNFPVVKKSDLTGFEDFPVCFLEIYSYELSSRLLEKIKHNPQMFLIVKTDESHPQKQIKILFKKLRDTKCLNPVIFKKNYSGLSADEFRINASIDFSPLFLNGFGDGLWLTGEDEITPEIAVKTSFDILQACRARITRTEYIACPSCGRTQYDIQKSLKEIKLKTSHLKGLKIAVMGCIVNGPGEMADADYGYVGSGAGKVSLFKGKKLVKKNVDESEAVEALIDLIKEHGDWKTEYVREGAKERMGEKEKK